MESSKEHDTVSSTQAQLSSVIESIAVCDHKEIEDRIVQEAYEAEEASNQVRLEELCNEIRSIECTTRNLKGSELKDALAKLQKLSSKKNELVRSMEDSRSSQPSYTFSSFGGQSSAVSRGEITPFEQQRIQARENASLVHNPTLTDFEQFLLDEAAAKLESKRRKRVQPKRGFSQSTPASVHKGSSIKPLSYLPSKLASTRLGLGLTEVGGAGLNFFDEQRRKRKISKEKLAWGKVGKVSLKSDPQTSLLPESDEEEEEEDLMPNNQEDSLEVEHGGEGLDLISKGSPINSEYLEDLGPVDLHLIQDGHCESFVAKASAASRSPAKRRTKLSTKLIDDGCEKAYKDRLRALKKRRLEKRLERIERGELIDMSGSEEEEDVIELDGGVSIPADLWDKLYKHQKTGVRWLCQLHQQAVGGIIADEMGLGKTIQVLCFLEGLRQCDVENHDGQQWIGLGPVLIVSPTTVMHQWVKEIHDWVPHFRVAILHESGSHTGSKKKLIEKVYRKGGILVTSYAGLTNNRDLLVSYDWHYLILDEGHKIKNPDASVTLAAKQFGTCHKLLLSGSPIQNGLKELWSVMDFVYPGLLGMLSVFMEEFAIPITQGGYANASKLQVTTAYKCACILRETISPYMLRRVKDDVQMTLQLPQKTEQVLFCRITDAQRALYREYLSSRQCEKILTGGIEAFTGLIILRKLCNHPDLVNGGPNRFGELDERTDPSAQYGYYKRSGKMIVLEALLKIWKKQGHKVLIFSQSRQMLSILQKFVGDFCKYSYLKMDGTTNIGQRQPLIKKFNEDSNIFIMLLTTRVGGLGVNLTGASRVLIFDPDWNPSTDLQAKERAWRIGQQKPVTVYRFLTTGTIEEKIYHRQIFKHLLSSRVLTNPKQRRFFKTNQLHELFTLGDDENPEGTETGALFAGTGSEIRKKDVSQRESKRLKKTPNFFDDEMKRPQKSGDLDDFEDLDSLQNEAGNVASVNLRDLAKKISQELAAEAESSRLKRTKGVKGRQHRRGVKIDGEKVLNLDKSEAYREGPQSETNVVETNVEGGAEEVAAKQNDYVLSKLFKRSKVHSVHQHDVIMEDSTAPDHDLINEEADRVARSAAKALLKSRSDCEPHHSQCNSKAQLNRFGSGGRKGVRNPSTSVFSKSSRRKVGSNVRKGTKEGPESSTAILTSIMRRKSRQLHPESSDSEPEPTEDRLIPSKSADVPYRRAPNKHDRLLKSIRTYIALQNGEATTKELVEKFGGKVSDKQSTVFRSLLKEICTFYKVDGEGVWRLKTDFK